MATYTSGGTPRVLVVDDEAMLADLLAQALRHEGWETDTAKDGLDALAKAASFHPDVVILDVQMPRMDGLETLERLRARDPELPVLFLTARDAVADRVQGLRAGADDYVTKPFDLDEVAARVEALLRRAGRTQQSVSPVLTVADLTLDLESHDVRRGGEDITLTNTEFELLRYLMENVGIVLSKQKILDAVWSYDFGGQVNVVELYISYLRKKIDADRPALIRTVRGAGYIMREPQSSVGPPSPGACRARSPPASRLPSLSWWRPPRWSCVRGCWPTWTPSCTASPSARANTWMSRTRRRMARTRSTGRATTMTTTPPARPHSPLGRRAPAGRSSPAGPRGRGLAVPASPRAPSST